MAQQLSYPTEVTSTDVVSSIIALPPCAHLIDDCLDDTIQPAFNHTHITDDTRSA